jgi:hypothetical protein
MGAKDSRLIGIAAMIATNSPRACQSGWLIGFCTTSISARSSDDLAGDGGSPNEASRWRPAILGEDGINAAAYLAVFQTGRPARIGDPRRALPGPGIAQMPAASAVCSARASSQLTELSSTGAGFAGLLRLRAITPWAMIAIFQ